MNSYNVNQKKFKKIAQINQTKLYNNYKTKFNLKF